MMSVFLFLLVLFVLILVHEWGHFIVAKKTGMQVDEFGIGFPPKLYGKKIGETEYTLNALPIGGFVRILGEDSLMTGEHANEHSYARSFIGKSKWVQAAVLLAGVTMNVVFAWSVYLIVFMVGVPTIVDETSAISDAQLVVTQVLADGPAATAGLPVGAAITGVTTGGETITALTPSSFRTLTEGSTNEMVVTYQLGNTTGIVTMTPHVGLISDDPERPAVGIGLGMSEIAHYSLIGALKEATMITWQMLVAITVGFGQFLAGVFTGHGGLQDVAGPIGIAGMVGDAAQIGLVSLLMFTAMISLNLAVINLLPFPALDGGRLLFVFIEAFTRRPINPTWVARLNAIGFGLLILLMVVVTYHDIIKLF